MPETQGKTLTELSEMYSNKSKKDEIKNIPTELVIIENKAPVQFRKPSF